MAAHQLDWGSIVFSCTTVSLNSLPSAFGYFDDSDAAKKGLAVPPVLQQKEIIFLTFTEKGLSFSGIQRRMRTNEIISG